MQTAKNTLVNKGGHPTTNRITVLDIFIGKGKSFSHARLMTILGQNINRVSLYRTLSDLVDAGILNRTMDSNGVLQYYFANGQSDNLPLNPHFKCKNCEQIKALPMLPAAYLNQILSLGHVEIQAFSLKEYA